MATKKRPVLEWKKVEPLPKRTVSARANEGRCTDIDGERGEVRGHEKRVDKTVKTEGTSITQLRGKATLRDLCTQDKQRVRQLVEQLAAIEEEKERLEDQIQCDRRQFTELLDKLKQEHKKVVEEKRYVIEELHSSQLQLQQLHTYPTLPDRVPRSHTSHMTPPSSHMTPVTSTVVTTSSHITSLPQTLKPLTTISPLSGHMTSITSTMATTSSHMTTLPQTPKPQTAVITQQPSLTSLYSAGGPSNHHLNDRGGRDSTPHSDDWHTLPSTSPQNVRNGFQLHETPVFSNLPLTHPPTTASVDHVIPTHNHTVSRVLPSQSHMTSVTTPMVSSTSHMTPIVPHPTTTVPHTTSGVTSTVTHHMNHLPSHMTYAASHMGATPTVRTPPTATLTTATSSTLPPKRERQSSTDQQNRGSQGTREASVQTLSTQCSSTQTDHTSPTPLTTSDHAPLTLSDLTPSAPSHSTLRTGPIKVKGHTTPKPMKSPKKVQSQHSKPSTTHQPSHSRKKERSKDDCDSLNTHTARNNVSRTPRGRKTEHSDSCVSGNGQSGSTRGDLSDSNLLGEKEEESCQETTDSTLSRPPATDTSTAQVESLLAAALLNAQQTLLAIESLSSSVGQDSSLRGSLVNRGELSERSVRAGLPTDRTYSKDVLFKSSKARSSGTVDSKRRRESGEFSGRPYHLSSPERDLVLSLNGNRVSTTLTPPHSRGNLPLNSHPHNPHSPGSHSWNGARYVDTRLLHLESDCDRSGRNNGDGKVGAAVTSTPFVRHGLSHKLDSQLGSTIADSEDDLACVSDILEHAHSLSRKLHTNSNVPEHAQSLTQSHRLSSSSDQDSETTSGDEIVEELFFV